MSNIKKGLAILAGVVLTVLLGIGLNSAYADSLVVTNTQGAKVKLTDVVVERVLVGTYTSTNGSNDFAGPDFSELAKLPADTERLIRDAGGTTMGLSQVDSTFCLVSVVVYVDKLAGRVDVPMTSECKNFPKGTVLGAIVSFAEDYTKETTEVYKSKFNVLK